MKRFHHQLLKGLLLFAILSLFQSHRTFAREDKDSSIRLAEALRLVKDHYKVDILFEDRTVEGLLVPSGLINFGRSAEENISALIGPFALNYKKVKARSYLIMADKAKKQSKIAGAITPDSALTTPALGVSATDALVLSQVVLSLVLPVPMIALLVLSGRRDVMGTFASSRLVRAVAVVAATVVLGLNLLLLLQAAGLPVSLPGSN